MPQTGYTNFYNARGPSQESAQRQKYQTRASNLEEEITRSHELLANTARIIAGMKALEIKVESRTSTSH